MNDLQRYRILLVDDEPTLRDAWTMVLSELGYDVATAADGFDALAQLRCTLPDLVISDLNMPRMSGFEFLKIMCVRFPKIPLIAMSGAYDSKDHFPDRLMVDAVYPKGRCQPEELGRIVAPALFSRVRARASGGSRRNSTLFLLRGHCSLRHPLFACSNAAKGIQRKGIRSRSCSFVCSHGQCKV